MLVPVSRPATPHWALLLPASRTDELVVNLVSNHSSAYGLTRTILSPESNGVLPKLRRSTVKLDDQKPGGAEGVRTPGLRVANAALSQLSYSPKNHQLCCLRSSVACRLLVAKPCPVNLASHLPTTEAGGATASSSLSDSRVYDSWWVLTGSNRRPTACKAAALPTELRTRINY